MMWWKRKRTYLDIAAGVSGNPSSPHEEGRRSREKLEGARIQIARLLEVQAGDVIFTSGATEANALAILGLAAPGTHLLYLPSAHASVVENMKLAEARGAVIEPLPIRNWGVDIERLADMIRPETTLVSMDAICGETGVIWNTREVAAVLKKGRKAGPEKTRARAARPIQHVSPGPALLHVDASQAPLIEKLTRSHFGADLLTLDASKVGEIRGIGALVAHRTIPLTPLYRGGGQERDLRPGSEAPGLARSFAKCLWQAANGRESFLLRAKQDRARLLGVVIQHISSVCVNESVDEQAPHILNLSFLGRDTDYLVALLDEAGYAVSTRSACETDSEEGSRAVFALTGDAKRARSTLRISWGPSTSSLEFARFAAALARAVAFIDSGGGG